VTLYSYCLRYDAGSAPNPYWDVCTLVICKPAIRRLAQLGDWVVGLGAASSPMGDMSGHVVYAMRITQLMTLREYDVFCGSNLPGKIPKWASRDYKKRVGDCIYSFSDVGGPTLRPSVHDESNRRVDLGGMNALLSDYFYYFGDRPRELPKHLSPIIHPRQGHKSRANAQYAGAFVEWIEGLDLKPNELYGEPQRKREIMANSESAAACSRRDLDEDHDDEIC